MFTYRKLWQVKKESRPLPLHETCSCNVFKTNNIINTSMISPVKWAHSRAFFSSSTAVEGKFTTKVSTANHFYRDRSVGVELNLESPTMCWLRSLSNDQLSPLSLIVHTEASFATAALWSRCKCSVKRKKRTHTKSDWNNSEEGNVVIFTKNCSNQQGYEKKNKTITTLVHKLLQLATMPSTDDCQTCVNTFTVLPDHVSIPLMLGNQQDQLCCRLKWLVFDVHPQAESATVATSMSSTES